MNTRPPSPAAPLKIGTRGSPLALAQAHETRERLMAAHGLPPEAFEIVVISTTGDRVQDRSLATLGGKGLFTKEIEEALSGGAIDIAVHSMKDMPVLQPAGLVLDCVLPREDPRDAFISKDFRAIAELPDGAIVGTSSIRRKAQLLNRRPDLQVVEFRGNVQTRLAKLDEGLARATLLAMAGLSRLAVTDVPACPIAPEAMLPAIAQGAIGIERRGQDGVADALLDPLRDAATWARLTAERAFLTRLDGSCQTPIAGLAELDGGTLSLRGEILRPDGSECLADAISGPVGDGAELGTALAETLLSRAAAGFFNLG